MSLVDLIAYHTLRRVENNIFKAHHTHNSPPVHPFPNGQPNMKLRVLFISCSYVFLPTASCASQLHRRNNTSLSCFNTPSIPVHDQCLFVREHCNSDKYHISRADYLKLYYCSLFRPGSLVLMLVGILVSFASLAVTASDYLCPNLYSISKLLQLSDNLAGLTLLALGNSAPDVVSTYKALEVDATGLAVSELMGAALFILTVVVGAISWAHPFKVPKFHFIRDILFYLTVSLICLLVLVMGSLTYWGSVLLFSTYVVYVAVVLFSHSVLWANVVHRANISRLRSTCEEELVSDLGDSRFDYFTTEQVSHPSIEILVTSEHDEERNEFDAFLNNHPHNARDEQALIETGSYGLRLLLRKLTKHTLGFPRVFPALTLTNDRPLTVSGSPQGLEVVGGSQQEHIATVPEGATETKHESLRKLLLPSIDPEAAYLMKLHALVTYPTNSLLRLTTPNREQAIEYGESISSNAFNFNTPTMESTADEELEDFDYSLDMKLFKIQFVAFPALVSFSFFEHSALLWAALTPMLAFFYGITFLIPEGDPDLKNFSWTHRFWNNLGSFMGFGASITWISFFATESVAILKALSVILSIRDDVLGATVFALGNSVGDLVSNITIARMGMPVMSFGACFGGPLLSISSLGLSAAVIMYKRGTQQIPVEFSKPLKLNCFALMATLIFLALYIPWNGWMFDRKVGVVLVMIWIGSCITTIASGL